MALGIQLKTYIIALSFFLSRCVSNCQVGAGKMGLTIIPPLASTRSTGAHSRSFVGGPSFSPSAPSLHLFPTSKFTSTFNSRIFLSSVQSKHDQRVFSQQQLQTTEEDQSDDEACELVNGTDLTIGEGEDAIRAYLIQAVKNNNGIGILLLSDIFGFEDSSTREFAYRTACNGYNVLVPDLFRGDPWKRDRSRSLFEEWLAKQDPERVHADIMASTEWMVNEFLSAGISKKLGLIGFCFGGGHVIQVLSKDESSRFGTGVSFYGTRMNKSVASGVKVPVLFIAGDDDDLCRVSDLLELEKIVGNGSKSVVYKGRGHGFAHRPESAEEDDDAEAAFVVMRHWLQELLMASSTG